MERLRLTAAIEAASLDDLAVTLEDIAIEIRAGRCPTRSVFASPSCSGVLDLATFDPSSNEGA